MVNGHQKPTVAKKKKPEAANKKIAPGYVVGDTKMYRGYEIPANTSKLAKKVLRRLKKQRFVVFEHDDGPAIHVHGELTNIADNIGLECYADTHKVVLIDSLRVKVIDGSKAKEKSCSPRN